MPRPKKYESMTDYKNEWAAQKYDRINLTVTKGKKQDIQAHAQSQRMSVNEYINSLIEKDMQKDEA